MSPARTGALAQRLIEIETYRTLAMLGLPLAQSLSSRVRQDGGPAGADHPRDGVNEKRDSQALLAELTELAAELEAEAAASLYRFGASRAYDGIVGERLKALSEDGGAGLTRPGPASWQARWRRPCAPAARSRSGRRTCRAS